MQEGPEDIWNHREEDQVRSFEHLFHLSAHSAVRELSNGHFSDDNQKRLVGIDTDIPVYEAKMGRDSRLIVGVTSELVLLKDCLTNIVPNGSHCL